MTWAARHRFVYISVLLLLIGSALFVLLRPYYTKAPTCFDQKKNSDEVGVDCGGGCDLYCAGQTKTPIILWSRAYKVTPSLYNVAAYIENQNPTAGTAYVTYEFRLYNADNILIARREGETFINPNGRQVVFEGGVETSEQVPKRTVFAFTSIPVWQKTTVSQAQLPIRIDDIREPVDLSAPKITAKVTNTSIEPFPGFKVAGIVYDEDNNAVAVSVTIVDRLLAGESKYVVFTWPFALGEGVFRYVVEPIIPVISVQSEL